MSAAGGLTPMMAQYLDLKRQHPDALLLFRMGDFYETFLEDAQDVANLLGLTLTSREKRGDTPIPLAGIPYHALEHYLIKLLDAGRTVAICEQLEDPAKAKGLVRRGVVEVISPGTVTNPALLRGDDAVYLMTCVGDPDTSTWGYALLDGSTGELRCGEAELAELASVVRRFRVGELVLPDEVAGPWSAEETAPATVSRVSPLLFDARFAAETLRDHFRVHGLEGLGLLDAPWAARAAGAALRYLADRQRARPDQVTELIVERSGTRLYLDRETLAHLELFEGARGRDDAVALFQHINATLTPMGRRTLAAWLRAPLCDPAAIAARAAAVEWWTGQPTRMEDARSALRGVGDLERIVGRIATRRALPHELAALRAGMLRLPGLVQAVAGCTADAVTECIAQVSGAEALAAPLQRTLLDEPPAHLRHGGIFRAGVDQELDRLVELAGGGKRWIVAYQEQERARTQIPSLKVGYNKVFGYYLEVTQKHLEKVPSEYTEKATLAGAKRYVTAELKQQEREILTADEERIAREELLWGQLLARMQADLPALRSLAAAVGRLDALASLASVARTRGWVRPSVDDGERLEIEGGRHPVVERLVNEPFTPNDLLLDTAHQQLVLLTGPNMGGKSTYLRQAAILVVLAQMGSFVPARRAHIGVVDRLFTRVGASDNLARGQSTFLVEMSETANILRNATARSLVILDEVGRGTSTDDGLALAAAITEYLHDGPVRPKTLFATHFHELTELVDRLPRGRNLQMEVREHGGQILFLHRVVQGASDRSYGIHVAELAGVPPPVLRRARELLAAGESKGAPRPAARAAAAGGMDAETPLGAQLPLFCTPTAAERGVLDRLAALEPETMRPIEALALLAELVERLRATPPR